jgi:hypothetical protein
VVEVKTRFTSILSRSIASCAASKLDLGLTGADLAR